MCDWGAPRGVLRWSREVGEPASRCGKFLRGVIGNIIVHPGARMPNCSHLEFVYTPEFIGSVEGLLSVGEQRALEGALLENPAAGALIPGTGGVRKLRFALAGGEKSGGARVLYVYMKSACRVLFLLAYPKNVRETLGQGEKNALRKWVQTL